jgi:hypothetical protein
MMSTAEMATLLAIYGASAEPIIPEGCQMPRGYILLHGPRGNKTCVLVDASGNVDSFAVRLWLDGITYGNAKGVRRTR